MIKSIGAANMHPKNRNHDEFRAYWAEHHGPLFSHTPHLRRYVQHITLPTAYLLNNLKPNIDGVSVFWFDDGDAINQPGSPKAADAIPEAHRDVYDWYVRAKRYGDPTQMTLMETVIADDRQLFDRATDWPTDARRSNVYAREEVLAEGQTAPSMVKAIHMLLRRPGLTVEEFQKHWREDHAQLVVKIPGLRRYVQNHGVLDLYGQRPFTHDGFSEMWFDSLDELQKAAHTPEWKAMIGDGQRLWAEPIGLAIAKERIQKEINAWPPAWMAAGEPAPRQSRDG
jgi:uncharacterized protein (TIGR02118 family)